MGVITDLDEGNISTSIEKLNEEERQQSSFVKIVSTINAHSSTFECVTRFCINTLFGDSAGERLIWLFKTDLIYSLEKTGVIIDLNEGNISISIEELSRRSVNIT